MIRPARVSVIGDAAVDYIIELPIEPAADEKVTPLRSRWGLGGTGANSAFAARSLGSEVTLHAAIGNDPNGQWVLEALRERGLDNSHTAVRPGRTAFATVLLRGEAREVIVDIGVGLDLEPLDLNQLALADLVYVSYSPTAIIALVAAGQGHRVVAGVEEWMVHDEAVRHALDHCRLLITNEAGWDALAGVSSRPRTTAVETRGSRGAVIYPPDGAPSSLPAHRVETVDATGAGDCFAGTLCHYLAHGHPVDFSVRRAMAAAAISTTVIGAQGWKPNSEQIDAALESLSASDL
ncbi:PfkB family carbohydrate kinase [Flaviflexus huanghaiensis]|uniref:PfkB family carbohydrate kinase n=1 Tax=Flaviflexus huanghaiensis TaxID=1111473 RepID=UPI0015FC2085